MYLFTIKNAMLMKKIFTLIAMALMAIGAQAQTEPVTYTFNNQASTYVLGDNAEATTYKMDEKEGFSVNYTGTDKAKMYVKLAANENIFFEYSNSTTKNNAVKTGENYIQCDSKNFIIHIPVVTGDVIYVKYSAKGSNKAVVGIDGSEPPVTANEDAVIECSGKVESEAAVFSCTATKGGTAKSKETSGGMRVYSISINQNPTGIKAVKADATENGATYNLAGQKVDESYKGVVIQNGKKVVVK